MSKEFFPARNTPKIYAYEDNRYLGCLKIGDTTKTVQERVSEQYPVKLPEQSYKIVLEELAIRNDNTLFTDKDIHRYLVKSNIKKINGEWFKCNVEIVKSL